MQIEALFKEPYHKNGGTKPRGHSSFYFDEDCLKVIDIKGATHYKVVVVVAPYFNLTKFDKYNEIGDGLCIDYHLRDFLCSAAQAAADVELKKYTAGTVADPITLQLVLDKRAVRQLYYRVPVDDNRYLVVKDAAIHNL